MDRRAARTCAIHSSNASLAISLGWNCRLPNRIQLRAPFTSAPTPGISTATSRASAMMTAIVDSERISRTGRNWAAQKNINPTTA